MFVTVGWIPSSVDLEEDSEHLMVSQIMPFASLASEPRRFRNATPKILECF